MTPSIVVGGVLLPRDHVLGVEQVPVSSCSHLKNKKTISVHSPPGHLVDHGGLEVNEDCSWYVFAGRGFREERVEGVVGDAHRVVGGHLTIGVNPCP